MLFCSASLRSQDAVATLIFTELRLPRPLRGLAMTVEVNLDLQNNSMQILINLCRRFHAKFAKDKTFSSIVANLAQKLGAGLIIKKEFHRI